jgi:hypothetical protein
MCSGCTGGEPAASTTEIRQQVTTPTDLDQLRQITSNLINKPCWNARLGYGDELTLDIGARVPCHPKLGPGREKGEWVLRARATPWRLEPPEGSPETPGDVPDLLQRIVGTTITDFETSYSNLALEVTFSNGYTLILMPETDEDDDDPLAYWELFTPDNKLLEVGPGPVWSYG